MIDLGFLEKNSLSSKKKVPTSAGNSKEAGVTKLPQIIKDENKKPLSEIQKASFENKIPRHILKSLHEEPKVAASIVTRHKSGRLNLSTNNMDNSLISDLKHNSSASGFLKRSELNSAITDLNKAVSKLKSMSQRESISFINSSSKSQKLGETQLNGNSQLRKSKMEEQQRIQSPTGSYSKILDAEDVSGSKRNFSANRVPSRHEHFSESVHSIENSFQDLLKNTMRSDGKNSGAKRNELIENINKELIDGINQFNNLKNETKQKKKHLEQILKETADLERNSSDLNAEEKFKIISTDIMIVEEKLDQEVTLKDTLEFMISSRKDDLVIFKEPFEVEKKRLKELEALIDRGTEELMADTRIIEKIQLELESFVQQKQRFDVNKNNFFEDFEIQKENDKDIERGVGLELIKKEKEKEELLHQKQKENEEKRKEDIVKRRELEQNYRVFERNSKEQQAKFDEFRRKVSHLKSKDELVNHYKYLKENNQYLGERILILEEQVDKKKGELNRINDNCKALVSQGKNNSQIKISEHDLSISQVNSEYLNMERELDNERHKKDLALSNYEKKIKEVADLKKMIWNISFKTANKSIDLRDDKLLDILKESIGKLTSGF